MLTKQEMFDTVYNGVLANGLSARDGACLYRMDYTASCPTRSGVGYFIPDDQYSPKLEGKRVGEDQHKSKLTEQDVLNIRASSLSQREIARQYGLHYQTVWGIINRKNWTHI